jgi:mono/diheme cytochrome c family protein
MSRCLPVAIACGLAFTASCSSDAPKAGAHVAATSDIVAGRYLVVVGGCNDCHTPTWAKSNGTAPEAQWLVGNPLGRKGPWGTTYAQNLRLLPATMSEDDFVSMLRTRKDRPPMPWMNLNRLQEGDARAIYRFIKSLGPAGVVMPPGLPPGEAPTTPYMDSTTRYPPNGPG